MEEAILFLLQSFSNPYLDVIMEIATKLGIFWIWLIVGFVLLWKERALAKRLLFGVPLLSALVLLIKQVVARPRPFETLNLHVLGHPSTPSFPSGHTAIAFFVAYAFSQSYPKYKYAFYAGALLVGLSRLYLGVHYPTDVLGGAALGLIFGFFFSALERKAYKSI